MAGSERASCGAADGIHVLRVRVYFEDTDATGIVYNANYLKFAERARTEFLRTFGAEHQDMIRDEGCVFAVRHCSVDFLKPAVLDDLLEVHSRIVEVQGASVDMTQAVRRRGTDLARLRFRIACMKVDTGRAARIPADIRKQMQSLVHVGDRASDRASDRTMDRASGRK